MLVNIPWIRSWQVLFWRTLGEYQSTICIYHGWESHLSTLPPIHASPNPKDAPEKNTREQDFSSGQCPHSSTQNRGRSCFHEGFQGGMFHNMVNRSKKRNLASWYAKETPAAALPPNRSEMVWCTSRPKVLQGSVKVKLLPFKNWTERVQSSTLDMAHGT